MILDSRTWSHLTTILRHKNRYTCLRSAYAIWKMGKEKPWSLLNSFIHSFLDVSTGPFVDISISSFVDTRMKSVLDASRQAGDIDCEKITERLDRVADTTSQLLRSGSYVPCRPRPDLTLTSKHPKSFFRNQTIELWTHSQDTLIPWIQNELTDDSELSPERYGC